MLKLMKYELRKTGFAKLVLLAVTALSELSYLLGVFLKKDQLMYTGLSVLVFGAFLGLFYIGIDSLLVFYRDLNTKQSYMLFLIPKNSYQILGAKVLENGISIFLSGAFFAALAAANATISILYVGGLREFLEMVQKMLRQVHIVATIDWGIVIGTFFLILAIWLLAIVTGYLAIVLSATVLAGKRFSGLVSFAVYVLLERVMTLILTQVYRVTGPGRLLAGPILCIFVMVAVMYAVTGWIMERKLSV